jgi:hypothetical protein
MRYHMQHHELLSPNPVAHRTNARSNAPTPWALMLILARIGGSAGWWLGPLVTRVGVLVIPTGESAAWYLTRSTGIVAYVVLTGSVVWGLLMTTKLVKSAIPAPLTMAMHSALSWLTVGLGALHAALLLLDHYYSYSLSDLLIPFTGPYRVLWVGLGIISLYGLTLISASFWVRKWMGNRAWRLLHFTNFPLFLLMTLHGIYAGTDSVELGTQLIYLFCGLLVLMLTLLRVFMPRSAPKPARALAPRPIHPVPARVGATRPIATRAQGDGRERAFASER